MLKVKTTQKKPKDENKVIRRHLLRIPDMIKIRIDM